MIRLSLVIMGLIAASSTPLAAQSLLSGTEDRRLPPNLFEKSIFLNGTTNGASTLTTTRSRLDEALRKVDRLQLENIQLRMSLQQTQLERSAAAIGALPGDKANILRSSIWPSAEIQVSWENPNPENEEERQWVREAIAETWEKESRLRFVGWGQANSTTQGIRILINDEGPHCKNLGRRLNGQPNGMVLNFSYNNWCQQCGIDRKGSIKKIAAHEFGHAIGFAHEQNRDDAPLSCQNERQGSDGDWYITLYDPSSIMNYCNEDWNNNGNLSSLDIHAARILYGEPARVSGEAKSGDKTGVSKSLTAPNYDESTLDQVSDIAALEPSNEIETLKKNLQTITERLGKLEEQTLKPR